MNRDDIIRMAREAGMIGIDADGRVERFAHLVAAAERGRVIAMLREMHEKVAPMHNYYAHAANLIEAME